MAETDAENPLIGTTIDGRYKIVRVLGEGGMGTVYEAEHTLIGRRVALKTLLPDFAKDKDLLERFRREARAASTIGNEHIVDVTDMGSLESGAPYLVMEMLSGHELADLMGEGPLTVGRSVRILRSVCNALAAAHAADIVHRDLKPSNIWLSDRPDGSDFPKLLDFGISKVRGDPNDQGLTSTGVAIGTPAYMSPEQAQGLRTVDHRSDVYAVGVILYEMLTTERPFSAESYAQLLIHVMMTPPPSVRSLRPDVPPEVDAIIQRALAKHADERFANISELAAALEPFANLETPPLLEGEPPARRSVEVGARTVNLSDSEPEATAAEAPHAKQARAEPIPASEPSLPRASRAPLFAVAAVALLAIGGLAAYAFSSPSDEDPVADPSPVGEPPPEPAPREPAPEPEPVVAAPPVVAPVAPVAPAAQEVRVQIRATPADARIFIGDTQFPSPMDALQPRSLSPTTIRIERSGYRTIERVVIFDQDRAFDFELSRGRGVDRGAPPGATTAPTQETPPAGGAPTNPEPTIYRGEERDMRREF